MILGSVGTPVSGTNVVFGDSMISVEAHPTRNIAIKRITKRCMGEVLPEECGKLKYWFFDGFTCQNGNSTGIAKKIGEVASTLILRRIALALAIPPKP